MYLKFDDFVKAEEAQHKMNEAARIEDQELLESLSEFNFEMIKEFEEYLDLDEVPLDESAFGASIKDLGIKIPKPGSGVDGKALYISIAGHEYGYQSKIGGESLDELARKFHKMIGLGAGGNALAWVKKNSNLVYGSIKNGDQRAKDMQAKAAEDLKKQAGHETGTVVI